MNLNRIVFVVSQTQLLFVPSCLIVLYKNGGVKWRDGFFAFLLHAILFVISSPVKLMQPFDIYSFLRQNDGVSVAALDSNSKAYQQIMVRESSLAFRMWNEAVSPLLRDRDLPWRAIHELLGGGSSSSSSSTTMPAETQPTAATTTTTTTEYYAEPQPSSAAAPLDDQGINALVLSALWIAFCVVASFVLLKVISVLFLQKKKKKKDPLLIRGDSLSATEEEEQVITKKKKDQ